MPRSQRFPDVDMARQKLGERLAAGAFGLQPKEGCKARPQVTPAEALAIVEIERAIGACGIGRDVERGAGEQRGVHDLKPGLEAAGAGGKPERFREFAPDRAIDCQYQRDVERIVFGVAADRVRTQRGPGPWFARLAAPDQVLVVIIEKIAGDARRVLPRGRGERPEMAAVILHALLQVDIAEVWRIGLEPIEQIGERLDPRRAGAGAGAIEHMGQIAAVTQRAVQR